MISKESVKSQVYASLCQIPRLPSVTQLVELRICPDHEISRIEEVLTHIKPLCASRGIFLIVEDVILTMFGVANPHLTSRSKDSREIIRMTIQFDTVSGRVDQMRRQDCAGGVTVPYSFFTSMTDGLMKARPTLEKALDRQFPDALINRLVDYGACGIDNYMIDSRRSMVPPYELQRNVIVFTVGETDANMVINMPYLTDQHITRFASDMLSDIIAALSRMCEIHDVVSRKYSDRTPLKVDDTQFINEASAAAITSLLWICEEIRTHPAPQDNLTYKAAQVVSIYEKYLCKAIEPGYTLVVIKSHLKPQLDPVLVVIKH